MDIGAICRVCLSDSIKMHTVRGTQLQKVYEKLAETKLDTEDGRPTVLCYLCYAQLRTCCGFVQAARRSEAILTQLCHNGVVFTQDVLAVIERPPVHNYSVTPIEYVDLIDTSRSEEIKQLRETIKKEIFDNANDAASEDVKDNIKADPDSDHANDLTEDIPIEFETDSEDDLPLKRLKSESSKGKRQKRKYQKRNKLDVREVTLSKEQQLQDVLTRATSLNYLNSPFRCALCYRGFVSGAAYRNHTEKHDERSGPHECEICKMRYKSARLLRTHTHSAHSRHYRCNKCGHVTHTAHQASDHERWHDGHTYECQLCGQKFVKRTSYLTHVRKRHPTEHVCNICGERFVGRHGLLMHKSKSHRRQEDLEDSSEPSDRFCAECNIQFLSLDAWKRHILSSVRHTLHTQQTKQCPICSRRPDSLSEHMKEHERTLRAPRPAPPHQTDGAARLACEQCGQTFVNKAKLGAHVRRIHLGLKYNKNIVCEVCGKKCTSNAALKYHQRTHTGERPHACACGKRFSDTNQLRIHARTHTGERPYSCEQCGKRFAQKPALNRHYRVHTGAKPYICDLCSKSFSQSNSLKVHVRAVHLKLPTYRRNKTRDSGEKAGLTDVGGKGGFPGVGVKDRSEEGELKII